MKMGGFYMGERVISFWSSIIQETIGMAWQHVTFIVWYRGVK